MINMYRAPTEQHITGSLSVCWLAQVFLSLVVIPTCRLVNLFQSGLKLNAYCLNTGFAICFLKMYIY